MKINRYLRQKQKISCLLVLSLVLSGLSLPVGASESPLPAVAEENTGEGKDQENRETNIIEETAQAESLDRSDEENREDGWEISVMEEVPEENDETERQEEMGEAEPWDSGEEISFSIENVEQTADPELAFLGDPDEETDIVYVSGANDLPEVIEAGTTYILENDIELVSGQQIGTLEGMLDGNGHVITLSDLPLADDVSGTIRNLGITGTIDLTGKGVSGSMAVTLTGVIRNCYSLVDMGSGAYQTVGGLVGTLSGGRISNSYFAGNCGSAALGGLIGYSASEASSLSYSFSIPTTYGIISKGIMTISKDGCAQKTLDEFSAGTVTSLLNYGSEDTGFYWRMSYTAGDRSMPRLSAGTLPDQADKTSLSELIDEAEEKQERDYTESTWNSFRNNLESATAVMNKEDADQTEVDGAASALLNAMNRLLPVVPVVLPEEEPCPVSSAEDLINASEQKGRGKYFILTRDIILDSSYQNIYSFYGVLDGRGHKISFQNSGPVFARLETGSVVQNLYLEGTLADGEESFAGPLGTGMAGAILNCCSEVESKFMAGFAGILRGGIISNCFSFGDTPGGALFCAADNGTVKNCWWQDSLSSSVPEGMLVNSGVRTQAQMTSMEFVDLMNSGRGDNGASWGQSSRGYPYFGENQDYDPESSRWPQLPGDNLCDVKFQSYNSQEMKTLPDARLSVSPEQVDGFHIAGTLSLGEYQIPGGCRVEWTLSEMKPQSCMAVNIETGELFVYGTGKGIASAMLIKSDSTTERIASVAIVASTRQMEEIRLYIDGEDVTGKNYTIKGSQEKNISVCARYTGEETFESVAYSSFTFHPGDTDMVYNHTDDSSSFYFKKPGTSDITVTYRKDSSVQAKVTITSEYVPVQSVVPAVSGTYVIHERNANSDGQETDGRIAYNPILGSVAVTPSYASCAGNVTVESSDESIGYYTGGEKAYIPKEAGTVTFTACIEDKNPETGVTRIVSGSSEVTFVYKNPMVSISASQSEVSLENGTKQEIQLLPEGELSGEGYSVTEPGVKWTYDKKGVVQIIRKGTGAFKRDESAPDNNSYFPLSEYEIVALSEGTAVATGTPLDTTNVVEPVRITITVTHGDVEIKNTAAMAEEGSTGAISYIETKYSTKNYAYGNEWLVYALLRAGREISSEKLDGYYDSVVRKVSGWNSNQKPTDIERVALALTMMKKDITDVGGTDLASMIYNSALLNVGSNELAFALLALDAADIDIPADARWNRGTMIRALLRFQNESGGFGLTDNQSASVDMTAMVVQALANYRNRPAVKNAIEKAVIYLQENMEEDFGYGSAESTAQVLLALSILGIDPLSVNDGFGTENWNMITNLMEDYRQADGGFAHTSNAGKSVEMSTVQVLEALEAYRMMEAGSGSYWNVNGAKRTVSVTVLGDRVHGNSQDGSKHSLAGENLEIWIPVTEYRLTEGTVSGILEAALLAADMSMEKEGAEIISVTRAGTTLAAGDNGENSCWRCLKNGNLSETVPGKISLEDGDEILLHYTDDYELEGPHTHNWNEQWSFDENGHWHECQADHCAVMDQEKKDGYGVHQPGDWITEEEKPGIRYKKCTICGYVTERKTVSTEEELPQAEVKECKEHSFTEWTTISEATVFVSEQQERICQRCGIREKREGEATLTPAVTINVKQLPLKTGQKTSKVKVSGLARGDSIASWSSSNTRVVKVTKHGVIKAQNKTGKATVTVTLASGKKAKIKVTVRKTPVKTRKITGIVKKMELAKGSKMVLKPCVTPITSLERITYQSSDPKTVSVTENGKLTARRKGTAVITVRSGSVKVKCLVTVA